VVVLIAKLVHRETAELEISRRIAFTIKCKLKIEDGISDYDTDPLNLVTALENTKRQILYRKIRRRIVRRLDPAFEVWIVGFVDLVHMYRSPVG
jgi:hypothetical protein